MKKLLPVTLLTLALSSGGIFAQNQADHKPQKPDSERTQVDKAPNKNNHSTKNAKDQNGKKDHKDVKDQNGKKGRKDVKDQNGKKDRKDVKDQNGKKDHKDQNNKPAKRAQKESKE